MTSTVMVEASRTVPLPTVRDATGLPGVSLPVGVAPQPRIGLHVADTCVADCYRCGIHNRLFFVTDHGVFTRCFSCHDEWRSTDAPWSCEHPQGFAPAPSPLHAPDLRDRIDATDGTTVSQRPHQAPRQSHESTGNNSGSARMRDGRDRD